MAGKALESTGEAHLEWVSVQSACFMSVLQRTLREGGGGLDELGRETMGSFDHRNGQSVREVQVKSSGANVGSRYNSAGDEPGWT